MIGAIVLTLDNNDFSKKEEEKKNKYKFYSMSVN
jgi:hypothetical protein